MIRVRYLNGKLKEYSPETEPKRLTDFDFFDQHFTLSSLLTPSYFVEIQNPELKLKLQDNLLLSYQVANRKILSDSKSFWIVMKDSCNATLRFVFQGNKKVPSKVRLFFALYLKPRFHGNIELQVINLSNTYLDLRLALRASLGASSNIHINIYNNYRFEANLLLAASVSRNARVSVANYIYLEHDSRIRLAEELLLLGSRAQGSIRSSISLSRGQGKLEFSPRIASLEAPGSLETSYRYLYPSSIEFLYKPQVAIKTEKAKVEEKLLKNR